MRIVRPLGGLGRNPSRRSVADSDSILYQSARILSTTFTSAPAFSVAAFASHVRLLSRRPVDERRSDAEPRSWAGAPARCLLAALLPPDTDPRRIASYPSSWPVVECILPTARAPRRPSRSCEDGPADDVRVRARRRRARRPIDDSRRAVRNASFLDAAARATAARQGGARQETRRAGGGSSALGGALRLPPILVELTLSDLTSTAPAYRQVQRHE